MIERSCPTLLRGLLVLTLGVGACAPEVEEPVAVAPPPLWAAPAAVPDFRPSDGLLHTPELQAAVDRQHARDVVGLRSLLSSESAPVRARAAFALASVGGQDEVAALLPLLQDAEADVRRDAAFALGNLAGWDEVDELVNALAAEDAPDARLRLIEALGRLRSRSAAEALLALEPAGPEAAARATALSRLGGPGGVEYEPLRDRLIEDLTAPDPAVREASAYFFRTQDGLKQWISRSLYLRLALDAYEKDDPAAMHLVKGLGLVHDVLNASRLRDWSTTAHDWRTRAEGMSGLDPMSASGPVLLDALDDPAPNVSVAAAERLARDAMGEGVVPHVEAWVREHPERLGAVGPLLTGLAQLDRSATVSEWVESTTPGDEHRWRVALEVISFMPGIDAIRLLTLALEDPSDRTARRASRALLRRWENDSATPETHDIYFQVFELASLHRVPQVAAEARRVLSEPPLRSRALEAGLDLSRPAGSGAQPREAVTMPMSVDWSYLAALGDRPRLLLETERGRITLELAPEAAPLTVQTVAKLAEAGRYDGVPFHRAVPNFVIQAGDFTEGDGTGDPGFGVPLERSGISFERGVVGMASRSADGTQASQFMILHSRQLELDGDFTAFGWVVDGMDVVDSIQLFDVISSATIER